MTDDATSDGHSKSRGVIYLFPDPEAKCWVAHQCGGNEAEIIALFETNLLPTPFMDNCDGEMVCRRIQALNPECTVEWFASKAEWESSQSANS